MKAIHRLHEAVADLNFLMDQTGNNEGMMIESGRTILSKLIAHDDWLPDEFARPHPDYYQQYLLYCDPLERFSIISFVWGANQKTPIHDHTVWGLIGVLRGAEVNERFVQAESGKPLLSLGSERLDKGAVDCVSPAVGDIHRVSNAYEDRVSISIHVYGADMGEIRRHVYDPVTGIRREFVSGYANQAPMILRT